MIKKRRVQSIQIQTRKRYNHVLSLHWTFVAHAQTTHTVTVKAPLVCTRPAVTVALCCTCTTELLWRQNSTSAGHLLTKLIHSL